MNHPTPPPTPPHGPGKIITLPRGATMLDDPKDGRPHVVLTPCGGDPAGILAYGSTQLTEAGSSAAYYPLKPQRSGVNRNGLTHTTYIYPGILVRPSSEDLDDVVGFTKEMGKIRETLVDALGLTKGTCRAKSAPAGSRRGRIIRVHRSVEASIGTPYAVIVTAHRYSAEGNYQAVIPVYDADALELDVFPDIAVVDEGGWIQELFGAQAQRAALVVPFMHSLWQKTKIATETSFVVEAGEMRIIEVNIRRHFALP